MQVLFFLSSVLRFPRVSEDDRRPKAPGAMRQKTARNKSAMTPKSLAMLRPHSNRRPNMMHAALAEASSLASEESQSVRSR